MPNKSAFNSLLAYVLGKVDAYLHQCVFGWMLEQNLPVHECDSPFLGAFLEGSDQPLLRAKSLHHKGYFAQACDAYVGVAREEGGTTLEERQVILQAALAPARRAAGAPRAGATARGPTRRARLRRSTT